MRILKYDFDYSRRCFMDKVARGVGSAGVLSSLWPTVGTSSDSISKAYPDELLSIELYTKGKIKPGDVIDATNVDTVKDLLVPIVYEEVKKLGRRLNIVDSTRDVSRLFNATFLDRTLKNRGRAKFGPDGNVWTDGNPDNPWIGGLPFPEPTTAIEAVTNISLSWGRHDYSQYAVPSYSLSPDGDVAYYHEFVWCELNATGRLDGTIFRDMKDRLRLQTVFFTAPNDVRGSSFLSTWPYDQRKFPDLYGYFPAFKRVRQFPTNQRFEPLVPGMTFFLSDAWAAGDPMLTWGNYRIIGRAPMLAAVGGQNWWGHNPNWDAPTHGGPKGKTFWDSYFELVPETIIVEAEPTGYPRAPVGRKRIWLDARNLTAPNYITYDRRGNIWKMFEIGEGAFENGKHAVRDAGGHPEWSWLFVHSHDIQSNRMTRLRHTPSIATGYKSVYAAGNVDVYNQYLTTSALSRLGI